MKNKTIFEEPEDLNDLEEMPSEAIAENTKDKNVDIEKPKEKKEKKKKIKKSPKTQGTEIKDDVLDEDLRSLKREQEELLHQDTKKFDLESEIDNEKIKLQQAKESWHAQKEAEAKEQQQIAKNPKHKKSHEDVFDFKEEKQKDRKHPVIFGFMKLILRLLIYVVLICGITYLILHYVAQRTVVDGSSMESTLHDKDNLIIDKLTYRFHDPKRFDIIVFPYQEGKKVYYIKRIIGLPGESVRIDTQGNIYINEKELQESYGREVMKDPGMALNGITLGKDEYFVLGDNRNDSTDSRSDKVGLVKRKDIIGRAVFRVYPFQDISFLDKKE